MISPGATNRESSARERREKSAREAIDRRSTMGTVKKLAQELTSFFALFSNTSPGRGLSAHRRRRGQLRRYPPEQARDRCGESLERGSFFLFRSFFSSSLSRCRRLPSPSPSHLDNKKTKNTSPPLPPRPQPASSPSTTSTRAGSSPAARRPGTPWPRPTLRSRRAAAGEEEGRGGGLRRAGSRQ